VDTGVHLHGIFHGQHRVQFVSFAYLCEVLNGDEMKKQRMSVVVGMALAGIGPLYAQHEERRPNIILFMVDDMGWQDTSVPFAEVVTDYNRMYDTPNMERLAQSGMLFTDAYAAPVSSPSRCSLMTGMNMARHRVTNWTLQRDKPTDGQEAGVVLPDWNCNGIAQCSGMERTTQALSFVQLLKHAGYHTIHCGKAHWGAIDTPGENPCHFGFEVNITGSAAGGLATYLSERNYGHSRDGRPLALNAIPGLERYWGTGTFATEALTQEALRALDKAKRYGQPFYLYLSHYALHIPIDKDMRFYPQYVRKGLSDKAAAYAALIAGMDKSLGDVMRWLEANGEAERTILIFMSDNGGLAASQAWREGPPDTQNAPLKSGKGSLYEGGIRVPFIVRWPGKVAANTRNKTPIIIEDLYPTLLEMAGIRQVKVPQTLDGQSLVPLLCAPQKPTKVRPLVWNFPNIWDGKGAGINLNCAIRLGDWKLIYHYKTGRKELYHLPDDVGEQHDLAAQQPQKVRKLAALLGKRLRDMQAQRPCSAATGKPFPWPDE
jgi:arylsulfatase